MGIVRSLSGLILADCVWWAAAYHTIAAAGGNPPFVIEWVIGAGVMLAAPFYGYLISEVAHQWFDRISSLPF